MQNSFKRHKINLRKVLLLDIKPPQKRNNDRKNFELAPKEAITDSEGTKKKRTGRVHHLVMWSR